MTRTQLLARVLADCYCRLQPSPIHGIGVFAIRDIPRRANPFGTLKRYARPGYVRITEAELHALPSRLADMVRALFAPTDGMLYLPTCGANLVYLMAYLNHSTAPNLRSDDGFTFCARRKIHSGEELTVDYRTYGAAQPVDLHGPARSKMEKPPDHRLRGERASGSVGPTSDADPRV
jgi:hypothetical protein